MNEIPDPECIDFTIEEGVITVIQSGGRITWDDGVNLGEGSVNVDGTFEVGIFGTPTDNETGEPAWQALYTLAGRFTGNRITLSVCHMSFVWACRS